MSGFVIYYEDTAENHLGTAIIAAAAIHLVLLLGIQFTMPEKREQISPTLEITLLSHLSDDKPEKADFLAQSSQLGGGFEEKTAKVTSPDVAPFPDDELQPIAEEISVWSEASRKEGDWKWVTTKAPSSHRVPFDIVNAPDPIPLEENNRQQQIVNRSERIASLKAQIEEQREMYAKRPRQRYISASTMASRDALYMEKWRLKVEKVGNLNYPDEALRNNLSGSVRLDVAINQDGTVHEILLRQSSGYQILDDAAIRSVRLAAPFDPLPAEIKVDTDILHIIRTWKFTTDTLTSR